jgi:hypothetical protein
VQDFETEAHLFFCSADTVISGVKRGMGTILSKDEAISYDSNIPHVTVFLILRKEPVKRLAPDGR